MTKRDARSMRPNWRTGLFNVRAHPNLLPACKEAAANRGMTLAEWVEIHMAAALQNEDVDSSFLTRAKGRQRYRKQIIQKYGIEPARYKARGEVV